MVDPRGKGRCQGGACHAIWGQVAIVTGGANGIGRACAEAFAAEGAAVVVADVDAGHGGAVARAIEDGGGRAIFVATDVGDAGHAGRLIEQTLAAFGRLDVLINNAGISGQTADFLEISEADFDAVLRVNLKGVFLVGQAAARVMVSSGQGRDRQHVLGQRRLAIANQVPYVTSKGAVGQLTKVMALALADKGVRVNAMVRARSLTDLLKVVMSDDAARRRILSRTPIGRCGEPAEIAKVAAVPRQRRGELHHRPDHLSRRRPSRSQLYGAGGRGLTVPAVAKRQQPSHLLGGALESSSAQRATIGAVGAARRRPVSKGASYGSTVDAQATAVWLVDNTSLTFEQIADFCGLHPLEVKGIADGEVARDIRGADPIANGQLNRDELDAAQKDRPGTSRSPARRPPT